MGSHRNKTISDEKLFRMEPFWFDGTSPQHQYRLCADVCQGNKDNSKDMHAVNNETPPIGLCFRIFRNFSVEESCQFLTDVQGNNSFEQKKKDKKRRREGRQKRVELESVRRALCWIHLQCHFLQWIFYITTFYKSLLWRYFLIRWPHGFIRFLDPGSLC